MERFFRMLSGSTSRNGVYSPKMIKEKNIYKHCSSCGAINTDKEDIKTVNLLLEGRGKYPDILICGEYPLLIVSEKVLDAWIEYKLTGFEYYNAYTFRNDKEFIEDNTVKYYNIHITGYAELDLEKMDVMVSSICDECGCERFNKETWEFGPTFLKEETWDGSDIFAVKYFESVSLCTIKNLECVKKNKLKNFIFNKGEDTFNYFALEIDVNKMNI